MLNIKKLKENPEALINALETRGVKEAKKVAHIAIDQHEAYIRTLQKQKRLNQNLIA